MRIEMRLIRANERMEMAKELKIRRVNKSRNGDKESKQKNGSG